MSELFSNLGIDWRLLLAQAINFLLVLYLLNRFVFKRIIRYLEERRKRIEEGLELTEKANREIERIDEARHRELERARKDAEKVLADARSSATAKEKATLLLARQEAEKIFLKAKDEAERRKLDTVRAAQGDIKSLAVLMAEKVLSRSVTKEDQERAAKEVMDFFEKNYANE